ncbi:MAG: hypothetical protein J2P25_07760, partial [Nocardiopsaceae bacterium]|nr:hypothetical protein [Nocardiopsaceae bacterium]
MPAPVLAGLALISAITAIVAGSAASAASTASPASAATVPAKTVSALSPLAAALTRAFEASRHVPGQVIGGIRAGTLHVGTANGGQWAIATFAPAASATPEVATAFQDGAATGVFTKANGVWRLVRTGSYACGDGLPAALKAAWHITAPASTCSASAASQRTAAQRALAALPASARASASSATRAAT